MAATDHTNFERVEPHPKLDVRRMFVLLHRSIGIILISMAVCFVGALGYVLLAAPKYTATSRLLLDPAGLQIVGTGLATPGVRDTSAIEAENQIYVITSVSVLEGVIAREKLDSDPLFGARPPSIPSRILSSLRLTDPANSHDKSLRQLEKAVNVSRSTGSFVLTVNVQTESRDLSVRIADAVMDVYMQEQSRVQAETARRAALSLDERLDTLREKVRTAEQAYERYRRGSGIVTVNGQPLAEKRATEVFDQINGAQSKVAELRSSLDQIRKVRDGNIDALPEAFRGGTLETLKNRYAAAQQAEMTLTATLGPRHPERVAARMQTAEARRLVNDGIHNVVQSLEADLERARAVETDLRSRFDVTKTDLGDSNEASVRLRELGREVEANRGIYDAFLLRSRELSERERFDTSNTRILSRAIPPLNPNGPPTILILVASLILGLGVGATLAWLRDLMSGSKLHNRPS